MQAVLLLGLWVLLAAASANVINRLDKIVAAIDHCSAQVQR